MESSSTAFALLLLCLHIGCACWLLACIAITVLFSSSALTIEACADHAALQRTRLFLLRLLF